MFYVQCPKTTVAAVKRMAWSESKCSKISGDAASRAWWRVCVCASPKWRSIYTYTCILLRCKFWHCRAGEAREHIFHKVTLGKQVPFPGSKPQGTGGFHWKTVYHVPHSSSATKTMSLELVSSLRFFKYMYYLHLYEFLHVYMNIECMCVCACVCVVCICVCMCVRVYVVCMQVCVCVSVYVYVCVWVCIMCVCTRIYECVCVACRGLAQL